MFVDHYRLMNHLQNLDFSFSFQLINTCCKTATFLFTYMNKINHLELMRLAKIQIIV